MAVPRNRIRQNALRSASVLLDLGVAALSFIAAYALVYNRLDIGFVPGIIEKTVGFVVVCAIFLLVFGVQRASWRYVSLPDLINLLKTSLLAVLVYTLAAFFVSRGDNVPRSVPILTALLLATGLAAPRILYRLAIEGHLLSPLGGRKSDDLRTVVILGLTSAADSFIRASRRAKDSPFAIAAILDEAGNSRAQSVQGVRIYGGLSDLPQLKERLSAQGVEVSELVVAEKDPTRQRLSEIVEAATACGLKTTRIPDLSDTAVIDSNAMLQPRPVELRDLLGRPEIDTDVSSVAALVKGKTVLATGAGGSIGSELVRQIASFGPRQLILTDNSEHNTYMLDKEIRERFPDLDIVTRLVSVRDRRRLTSLFQIARPDVVFHAAALKHVPLVEANPLEGIKTNVLGTRNAVDAALTCGVSTFIMISTDKAVNPTNVMGATKRAAEAYCQAMDVSSETTRFKTVRFGNVLGSNGSVVPRFQEQIRAGGPVTVTHPDIVRYFMTIPEAVSLVLRASSHENEKTGERGKIMVLDMGQPVRIADLAERMIQLAGYKPNIDIPIVFSGLRPGEKLFEELFDPEEAVDEPTSEGYVVASPRVIDDVSLFHTISQMDAAATDEDAEKALKLLRRIVPEYRVPGAVAPVGDEPVIHAISEKLVAKLQAG